MSEATSNLSIVLAERPKASIIPGQTFHQKRDKAPVAADLQDGEVLIENLYLSLDPAMRGWLNDARSYVPPVPMGGVMRGATIARVLASKSSSTPEGAIVTTSAAGWTQLAILPASKVELPGVTLPNPERVTDLLSGLGMTGLTAYFGMIKIGEPKPGDLVVVSGAAGATGSVAGQIAKIKGARVVGIAGSPEKVKWLTETLGFDVGLNYKDPDFRKQFVAATQGYIDVYFDNVGGEILDMALARAKPHARFVMCGNISQYNAQEPQGPKNMTNVVTMRIKMQGFVVFDFASEYGVAREQLAQWLRDGQIKTSETVVKGGLEAAERALVDLYKGINTGKLLVEIKPL